MCARRRGEYLNFLNIATGSCAETRYLVELAYRLQMLHAIEYERLYRRYTELFKGLQALLNSLDPKAESPKPKASR